MSSRKRPPDTGGRASDPGETIRAAIEQRRRLQFNYKGRRRVVEPYCYGLSTRDIDSLRAVQIRGLSSSNGLGFGKLWTVSEMSDLCLLEKTFTPDDPDYNPNDTGMNKIHCRI